jgi:hypothetical protein
MVHFGVCSSVLESVRERQRPDIPWSLLSMFINEAPLKILADRSSCGKGGVIFDRYFDIAEGSSILSEWLNALIEYNRHLNIHYVDIEGAFEFESALIKCAEADDYCRGIITPFPRKYAKQNSSVKLIDTDVAIEEIREMTKGSSINITGSTITGAAIGSKNSSISVSSSIENSGEINLELSKVEEILRSEAGPNLETALELLSELRSKIEDNKSPGILQSTWDGMVKYVPALTTIAVNVPRIWKFIYP